MSTTIKGGFSTKNKDQMNSIARSIFRDFPKKVEKTKITKRKRNYRKKKKI